MLTDTFFGTPEQQALLRRGRGLYELLKDDPRLFYYGRTVGLLRPEPGDRIQRDSLIAVQGATSYSSVNAGDAAIRRAALEVQGYTVTDYARWTGGMDALKAARAIVASYSLPEGVTVRMLGPSSPHSDLALLAQVALASGVLPTAGSMLCGVTRRGVSLVAVTEAGVPVGCGAACLYAPRSDPEFGREAWWGMLATAPDFRGQRLALILGAMAMLEMHARHGIWDFMTGVVPGNTASESVCERCGLVDSGRRIFTIVDPGALPGGKMTS